MKLLISKNPSQAIIYESSKSFPGNSAARVSNRPESNELLNE